MSLARLLFVLFCFFFCACRCLGGWHDDVSCWLVLPRMQRTLRNVRPSRSQQQSGGLQGGPLRIARCVASAMCYLHQRGVIHRDLQVGRGTPRLLHMRTISSVTKERGSADAHAVSRLHTSGLTLPPHHSVALCRSIVATSDPNLLTSGCPLSALPVDRSTAEEHPHRPLGRAAENGRVD